MGSDHLWCYQCDVPIGQQFSINVDILETMDVSWCAGVYNRVLISKFFSQGIHTPKIPK